MSLFQTSVLKKYIKELNPEIINKKFIYFNAYFGNQTIQENIRNLKEEEFQEDFVRELFVKIFEYTLKPEPGYHIELEKKNTDNSKKADGAIVKNNKVMAVIELKSNKLTDLDNVELQAFNYKNHHSECTYVITSNFEKIRFYIQNAIHYLEFDLFNLTKQDFELLWLCLSKNNLYTDIPLKIKEASVLQEETVTKKLYHDYSKFREEIYHNIIKNNPGYDKLLLFKKTQKLLDRFLFIFFAEDRLLLPPNSISQIIEKWKDDVDFGDERPLYSIFKKYFHVLNTGRPQSGKRQEVFAYNGGLFFPDEVLDTIKIDDDVLQKHTLKLSTYDFETEVDVNILGHIFEHSLEEIERVQAEIEGKEVDKQKSKRKKDGIFYTPKYITKYIVESTIGKLCKEKKAEFGILNEEYAKGRRNRKKEIVKSLNQKLDDYRNWLLNISILDPACGSGAFLNQALDFLIIEHKKIDELKFRLLGGSIIFPDIETKILEKNIYGVDLNEESVEIAKLSLWLRTAQKGRKLTTLSNHIRCGNSLVDNAGIAGEKAFDWYCEFPDIFIKKKKEAWHVTMVLHNSRYANMNGYTKKKEAGYIAPTYPELSGEQQLILAEELNKAAIEYELNILECNVCTDHVHALMVCEEDELSDLVRKWKGRTAFEYNRKVNPSVSEQPAMYSNGTKEKFWAKSFHKKRIKGKEQLENTIQYIQNNREKHQSQNEIFHEENISSLQDKSTTTARLTLLLNKMKCTYQHAFRTEYKGGFDVLIGNPPYVQENIPGNLKLILKSTYETIEGKIDLYRIFIEKGIKLTKQKGFISFITPNSFLTIPSAKKLRAFIKNETSLISLINFKGKVFEQANMNTVIFNLKKIRIHEPIEIIYDPTNIPNANSLQDSISKLTYLDYNSYSKNDLITISPDILCKKLIKKISNRTKKLSEIADYTLGLQVYHNTMHKPDEIKNRVFHSINKKNKNYIPEIGGKNILHYGIEKKFNEFVAYGDWCYNKPDNSFLQGTRIFIREIPGPNSLISCIFDEEGVPSKAVIIVKPIDINAYFLTGILNSNLIGYYIYNTTEKGKQKLFPRISLTSVKNLPIKAGNHTVVTGIERLVLKIIDDKKNLNEIIKSVNGLLISKYKINSLTKKLQNWNELNFKEFLKELSKLKVKFTLSEEMEWIELFEQKKSVAQKLMTEIEKTGKEINHMVYELYGLSEEEIKVVEKKTKL